MVKIDKGTRSIIGIFFLLILNVGNSQIVTNIAQDKSLKDYRVKWVNQFPLTEQQSKTSDKRGWFSRFIFGRKNIPKLTKPVAIIASNPGSFMILDQGSGTIFQIKNNEKKVIKVLKKNKINFTSLVGFCEFYDNQILFTDSRLNKIFRLDETQRKLEVLNDNLQLQQPTGIAYSAALNQIWVVETAAHRISILNIDGKLIKTIGRRGVDPGEFNFPTSIWIDNLGNVYVIDAMNFRVQIFNKTGEIISVFGETGNATGYFARPKGIATDSYGNIYIPDALYHTVQIFDLSGNFLYQFGEQGRDKEQFWMPSGIYIDDENFIYVADSYNSRIQIFKLIRGKQNEKKSH